MTSTPRSQSRRESWSTLLPTIVSDQYTSRGTAGPAVEACEAMEIKVAVETGVVKEVRQGEMANKSTRHSRHNRESQST